jgi:hypothetical protein
VVGGEEEADGAAFGEVASEEGVEFVEQLFAEVGKALQIGVDGFAQARFHHFLEVARLDAHQVDVARLAFNRHADEDVFEGFEELLLLVFRCVWRQWFLLPLTSVFCDALYLRFVKAIY